jgi:hypothetical protein
MSTKPPEVVFDPDCDMLPAPITDRYGPEAVAAWRVYERRQLRREHPDGWFEAGRWYPSPAEHRPCCDRIRRPSGRFPYSLMNHCRSAGHVGRRLGVDPTVIRSIVGWLAWYGRMAWTAPSLCLVCGASWSCEHGFSPLADVDPTLYRVPDSRADLSKHLGNGGWNR